MHRAWLIGFALLLGTDPLFAAAEEQAVQSFAVEVPIAPVAVRSEGRQLRSCRRNSRARMRIWCPGEDSNLHGFTR